MSVVSGLALIALIQAAFGQSDDDPGYNQDTEAYKQGYHHLHAQGYQRIFENYTVNGVPFQQISGLSNNFDEDNLTYYAISDAVDYTWTNNKQIYIISFENTDDDTILSSINSIDLDDPPVSSWDNLQTQSIALINDNYNWRKNKRYYQGRRRNVRRLLDDDEEDEEDKPNYFIIATEGDRAVTDRTTNFFIYNYNGSYASTLDYNEWIFGMTDNSGFKDNAGPDSMTTTPDRQYILWIASDTLKQDYYCADKGCVRMVLQMVNYTTDPPTWKEMAQFRYDKDIDIQQDSRYSYTTVTDVTTVDNTFDQTLILEKTEYIGDDNETIYYHTKAYHISLSRFLEPMLLPEDEDDDGDNGDDGDGYRRRNMRRLLDGKDGDCRRRRRMADGRGLLERSCKQKGSIPLYDIITKYDISSCYSLHPDNCSNYDMVIGKNLTSDFDVDLADTVPFAKEYHVDSVSHGPGNKCGSYNYNFVLGVTDSMEGEDTHLLYLCYHSTQEYNYNNSSQDSNEDSSEDDLGNKINIGLSVVIGLLTYLLVGIC